MPYQLDMTGRTTGIIERRGEQHGVAPAEAICRICVESLIDRCKHDGDDARVEPCSLCMGDVKCACKNARMHRKCAQKWFPSRVQVTFTQDQAAMAPTSQLENRWKIEPVSVTCEVCFTPVESTFVDTIVQAYDNPHIKRIQKFITNGKRAELSFKEAKATAQYSAIVSREAKGGGLRWSRQQASRSAPFRSLGSRVGQESREQRSQLPNKRPRHEEGAQSVAWFEGAHVNKPA